MLSSDSQCHIISSPPHHVTPSRHLIMPMSSYSGIHIVVEARDKTTRMIVVAAVAIAAASSNIQRALPIRHATSLQ